MGFLGQTEGKRSSWRVLLTLVCVLLVAVSGTIQVAHTHPDRNLSHADCSLCAATHVSVQVVATPAPLPAIAVVAALEAVPTTVASSTLSTFALFTRPPPAV